MTEQDDINWGISELKSAITRLADDAPAQVKYLTEQGLAESADELAIEFDDAYRFIICRQEEIKLSENLKRSLEQLDLLLKTMSGQKNERLWTFSALKTEPEWEAVRRIAASIHIDDVTP